MPHAVSQNRQNCTHRDAPLRPHDRPRPWACGKTSSKGRRIHGLQHPRHHTPALPGAHESGRTVSRLGALERPAAVVPRPCRTGAPWSAAGEDVGGAWPLAAAAARSFRTVSVRSVHVASSAGRRSMSVARGARQHAPHAGRDASRGPVALARPPLAHSSDHGTVADVLPIGRAAPWRCVWRLFPATSSRRGARLLAHCHAPVPARACRDTLPAMAARTNNRRQYPGSTPYTWLRALWLLLLRSCPGLRPDGAKRA